MPTYYFMLALGKLDVTFELGNAEIVAQFSLSE